MFQAQPDLVLVQCYKKTRHHHNMKKIRTLHAYKAQLNEKEKKVKSTDVNSSLFTLPLHGLNYLLFQIAVQGSHLVEKNLSGIKLYGNHTCVATHVSKGEQCSLQIVQIVPKKRVQVNQLYAIQADSSKPNPRMQAVEISNSTFIVELEGSIYPNRTQEEGNSMKNHVSHLICIVTPGQYFIAHYGCRQITKVW